MNEAGNMEQKLQLYPEIIYGTKLIVGHNLLNCENCNVSKKTVIL